MSDDNKPTIEKVYLESVNLEANIIIIPEGEIESRFDQLASEKGLITRANYEEFLLENCAANLFQLSKKIEQHPKLYNKAYEFREELIEKILQLNTSFDPEEVYIDRSGKLSNKETKNSIKLSENQVWDRDDAGSFESQIDQPKRFENPFKDFETEPKSEWWERLKMYIIIKKYKKEDCAKILTSRLFYDRQAFEAFIVTVCVQNFEELFKIIDAYGLSQRVPPPMLMHELYEICKKVNTTLLYENAQSNGPDVDDDEHIYDSDPEGPFGEGRYAHASAGKSKRDKKKKKRFKDVPREALLILGDSIKEFIVGQDPAVDVLVEAIQRGSVGLRDPEQPIGSFIFAGSTGIGKTETTKVLNDVLIKEREGLIKIDCSEYQSDHEYAKLIGAPAGYIGHDEGGVLTNAIRKNPFAIVVFDEVEKASTKVHDLMLQIMDEGRLTDGKGKTASFKDAIIIMTSNVGVKTIKAVEDTIGFGDVAVLTEDKRKKAFNEALKKKFKPEFLNRVDEIVYFMPLKRKDYLKIVDLELNKVLNQLKKNSKITVVYNTKVRNKIYKEGTDEKYGARPLKRCIKRIFSNPLAQQVLHGDILDGDYVKASVESKEIVFQVVRREKGVEDPPFYLTKTA
jgi:DNA polymerase III delta prime subunit